MERIPLEDSFSDVAQKAQRGLKISDGDLSAKAGISPEAWQQIRQGGVNEESLRKVAPVLGLHPGCLVTMARKLWYPEPVSIPGLAGFNTTYEDMTVNSYLVWDAETREAAVFDTGATVEPILNFVRSNNLKIKYILLTHTHQDHIADLERLRSETGAPTFVARQEPVPGAELIGEGNSFSCGSLKIDAYSTTGHSVGGITYVVSGLSRPVAVVGDALFASSMGGGIISFREALETNRKKIFTLPDETIICPGHGPMTTLREEKQNNPFYPEFKSNH